MKLRSLLAVALLTPAVALAAPAAGSKSSKSAAKAAQAKPESAPASATEGTPLAGLEVGGFLGYETADFSGVSLRVDGELPFRQLAPQVKLSLVGSVGYSRLSWDPASFISVTANMFKLVPAARFTIPLAPQFSVFGDAGLGLAYLSYTAKFKDPFGLGQSFSASDSSTHIMMRFGAGAWYQVNERMKVGALLELDPIFGDAVKSGNGVSGGSQNFFLVQAGMMYRL